MKARVLSVAALFAMACGSRTESARATSAAAAFHPVGVGDTVPAYAAVTLAGDSVLVGRTSSPAKLPLTLVNVWATWCGSCREEFDEMETLSKTYGPKGLRVLAVSVDEGSTEKVRRFVEGEHATFTIVHDAQARINDVLEPVGVPSSYLVAPDGRVVWAHTGVLPADIADTVQKHLASLSRPAN